MTKYEQAYEEMARWEGGYSDDKYDPGGKTIWGVTKKNHPATFNLIMGLLRVGNKKLAKELAKGFYKEHYWNDLYDEIPDSSLAFKLFDFGVNAGVKRAVKILQRTINKDNGKCSTQLKVDGIFGEQTLSFVVLTIEVFNVDLYDYYIKRLGRFYRSLGTFWRFGRGWMRRLNNRKYLE